MKIVKVILFVCSIFITSVLIAQENYTIVLDGKEVLVDGLTNKVISNVNTSSSNITSSENGIHIVKPKENLYRISKAYKISVSELCSLNNMDKSTMLKVGQKLIVANNKNITSDKNNYKVHHIVQKGDTLFSIAKKYGITLTELKKLNNLNSNNILLNQKLRIQ